jgi:putative membrane fusion protein
VNSGRRRKFAVLPGKKNRRKRFKPVFIILGALTLCFALYLLYSLAHDYVASRFVQVTLAEKGVIQNNLAVSGMFLRDEQVVAAPVTGRLTWLVREGTRLAAGTPVAELAYGNQMLVVSAPEAGVVALWLDGLEGVLQPGKLPEIDLAGLLRQPPPKRQPENGELVEQGSMLFKMADNYRCSFLFALPHDEFLTLGLDNGHLLHFTFDSGQKMSGRLAWHNTDANGYVTLAAELLPDVGAGLPGRFAEALLLVEETRGVTVPASALVQREGGTGIYTLVEATVRFRSVEIRAVGKGKAVVEGLNEGITVIANPWLVKEGQRL